jgi:hypothetical protein
MQALFTSAVVWPAMVFYAVLDLHIGKVRMKNRLASSTRRSREVSSSSFLLLVKRLPTLH